MTFFKLSTLACACARAWGWAGGRAEGGVGEQFPCQRNVSFPKRIPQMLGERVEMQSCGCYATIASHAANKPSRAHGTQVSSSLSRLMQGSLGDSLASASYGQLYRCVIQLLLSLPSPESRRNWLRFARQFVVSHFTATTARSYASRLGGLAQQHRARASSGPKIACEIVSVQCFKFHLHITHNLISCVLNQRVIIGCAHWSGCSSSWAGPGRAAHRARRC